MLSFLRLFVFSSAVIVPSAAHSQGVYYSTKEVLRAFFPDSERVTYEVLDTAAMADALTARLGYLPGKKRYVVFVAQSGEQVDGYAVIEDEQGQHLPITFAVKLSPGARVQRTEVMVYREGYGHEIREARFRQQFVGKGDTDPLRLGHDVVAISGATISSRSMAVAVRRVVAVVEVLRGRSQLGNAKSSTSATPGKKG